MSYVIGLDIGTTCTKALVADDQGNVCGIGSSGYSLISKGNRIEQKASDWIEASVKAVREAVKQIDAAQIKGISLSTQGSSTAAVDREGMPVGNAVTWMDTRAEKEAAELEEKLGGDYIYHTTGWKINPALDAAKLCHMKKDPQYAGAAKYLSTLEIMNGFLTGNAVIDPTNAAIRQLFDVERNCWDEKILEAVGIKEEELPCVLPAGAVVGGLEKKAAECMGLPEGIPVFNGAHDQYCASIGAGAVSDGDMLLSAGTTWVLMGIGKKPLFTESCIAPGKHPVEGLYGAIASLVCSGASLQWFKNEFLPEDFAEMNEKAALRRERTKELFFYPYLAGANYPLWNLNAKGVFAGLTLEHDRFDLARSIMEGVAFGVRRATEDFMANGSEIRQILMMGGASKSPLWCQMIASITRVPIHRLNQADICALGAAMIAACGLGLYRDYAEAARMMVHTEHIYEPDPEETAFYDAKYGEYEKLWGCMQQYYKK